MRTGTGAGVGDSLVVGAGTGADPPFDPTCQCAADMVCRYGVQMCGGRVKCC
jgi:hypothetical protein